MEDHDHIWTGNSFSKFRNFSTPEPQPIRVIKNGEVRIVPPDYFHKYITDVCGCGCGETFIKNNGKRKYIEGHQP